MKTKPQKGATPALHPAISARNTAFLTPENGNHWITNFILLPSWSNLHSSEEAAAGWRWPRGKRKEEVYKERLIPQAAWRGRSNKRQTTAVGREVIHTAFSYRLAARYVCIGTEASLSSARSITENAEHSGNTSTMLCLWLPSCKLPEESKKLTFEVG